MVPASGFMTTIRNGYYQPPLAEVHRLNSIRKQKATVYSLNYSDPLTSVPGSIQVSVSAAGQLRPIPNGCPRTC